MDGRGILSGKALINSTVPFEKMEEEFKDGYTLHVTLTQEEYDALPEPRPSNTYYYIPEE